MTRASHKPSHNLAALKRRHSDRSTRSALKLAHVSDLGKKGSVSGSFKASHQITTPFGQKQIFRSLHAFFFMEMSLLLLWIAYRSFVHQPIWFDEGIAKAVVFGLPVVWFASRSRFIASEIGLDAHKLIPGLYMGLAVGGLYGFVAILSQVTAGRQVVEAALFASPQFWWMAFLALLTSWWESLFFFGLPVQYLRGLAAWFSEWMVGGFAVVLFLLFHAPLRFLIAGPSPALFVQLALLALFALGQYILYTRTKNMYCIVLSHLLWGLVIEVYAR